jgi:hypothetical protein
LCVLSLHQQEACDLDNIPTLTHATERDVDLLLVEELKCSADFVRWFVHRVVTISGTPINVAASNVTHSKRRTYNRREIDICLDIKSSTGHPTYFLIENKLDTGEQFEQAESYRAEAKLFVERGEAAYTVLVYLLTPLIGGDDDGKRARIAVY